MPNVGNEDKGGIYYVEVTHINYYPLGAAHLDDITASMYQIS